VSEVKILVIDDDITSQRALKNILDSEGWQVRIVPLASQALAELASAPWNLVIVNVALLDLRGPLFLTLKELARADVVLLKDSLELPRNRIRVLFLVPVMLAKGAQLLLERESLPYTLKPYHLHDFLEKVSELLVESGAIEQPIRGNLFREKRRRRDRRASRDARTGAMFASREDYQMSEEEMMEYELQEELERKKREKELKEGQR
jgi:DNA-binding response OmpR family regulator